MPSKALFLLLPLAVGAMILVPERSTADEYHLYLTVSCVPEIAFFAVRNYGIYRTRERVLGAGEILTTEELERHPYTCNLMEGVNITVKGFCRSQTYPEPIGCGLGMGARVEQIAIFVNDEILPLIDPPARTSETLNWLSIEDTRYFSRHSVEISGLRPFGIPPARLNVLQCRSHEGSTPRYESNPARTSVSTECRSFEKAVRGN